VYSIDTFFCSQDIVDPVNNCIPRVWSMLLYVHGTRNAQVKGSFKKSHRSSVYTVFYF
jgi:hypothetical protein